MINPIVKTISFKATKPPNETKHNLWFRKHIIHFNPLKLTEYRAAAYTIELVVAIILCFFNIFSVKFVIPIVYMFLYRSSILLAVKLKLLKYSIEETIDHNKCKLNSSSPPP
jgi:predicted tellurium resistance membrane protein TerC